jgi:hypothetical protein
VQHALGLAGRTGRIEDKKRVFGAHRFGRAIGRDAGANLVQPVVAAFGHRHVSAGAAHNEHFLDHALGNGGCRVSIDLERHLATTPETFVGGDQNL